MSSVTILCGSERHGDDWPLQIYWACVFAWAWSMVMKAVVWVGPYCWLRGSDHEKPALSRYLETEGNVSLTQHFRDTCRVCQWLEAESKKWTQSPLPRPPSPSLCPQISLPPFPLSLLSSPTHPSQTLSLHPHSLPSPLPFPFIHWAPPTLYLPIFHLFIPLSPTIPPSAAPGIGKEFSCVAC